MKFRLFKKEKLKSKLKITEEERNILIEELAERLKDVVYMNARRRVEEFIDRLLDEDLEPNQEIIIHYKFALTFNDILQILGRVRRQKETICEVCHIHKATTKIDFGAWKDKNVCEICYHNYWVASESSP